MAHRLQYLFVRSAAAKLIRERLADLILRGIRNVLEQGNGAHDHTVQAVAALRALAFDERLLHGMQSAADRQSLQRRDAKRRGRGHRQYAAARRLAVEQHQAGTALTQTAAVLWTIKTEVLSQHLQQRHRRVDVERMRGTVDSQLNESQSAPSPRVS